MTDDLQQARVEAAAKALYEVRPNGDIAWDSAKFDDWMEREDYRVKARAALAAADEVYAGDYHEGLEEGIKIGLAEHDAALAAIERVRDFARGLATGGDGAGAELLLAVLDGATEPAGLPVEGKKP